MGIYPFDDGKLEDFEKVFAKLIEVCRDAKLNDTGLS
jgi:hypothetical protein